MLRAVISNGTPETIQKAGSHKQPTYLSYQTLIASLLIHVVQILEKQTSNKNLINLNTFTNETDQEAPQI